MLMNVGQILEPQLRITSAGDSTYRSAVILEFPSYKTSLLVAPSGIVQARKTSML